MSPDRQVFWRWALVGVVFASCLMWVQADTLGGASGLLRVGRDSNLRPLVESQLGTVPHWGEAGHDGHILFAIGTDLLGREVGPLLDDAPFRYRRILFPAVASLFGLLEGPALLYSMMILSAASVGLATGATAVAAVHLGLREGAALAVLANPGVWAGVRLLTADALALGLMCLGLLGWVGQRRGSVATMALATLARETQILTALGLGFGRKGHRKWRMLLAPLATLGVWSIWVYLVHGSSPTTTGVLTIPFKGMVDSWDTWLIAPTQENLHLLFALGLVALGVWTAVTRKPWLRSAILLWTLLAIVTGPQVWAIGSNAARAFAPILVLTALSRGERVDPLSPAENLP